MMQPTKTGKTMTNIQSSEQTLCDIAMAVLSTADPWEKARITRQSYVAWQKQPAPKLGTAEPNLRPARSSKPALLPPNQMPKRGKAGSKRNKVSLLHALAHIELNAIDLAWDIVARFSSMHEDFINEEDFTLPTAFFTDWAQVADDEAKHFLMLSDRLQDLDANYGDLPAHDGLWEAAEKTADDFAGRLAIVPMVLEARGLDVTPQMIAMMERQEDHKTAEMLKIIHDDEITHVRAGTVWFKAYCKHHNLTIDTAWQGLVIKYFNGLLKPPFNHPSREKAEMIRDWYEDLSDILIEKNKTAADSLET